MDGVLFAIAFSLTSNTGLCAFFDCENIPREMWVQEVHDGYTKWRQPPNPGTSCCNDQDCSRVEGRFDEKRGVYQALIDGEWRDIPPEIILDPKKPENTNPDGGYHACWNRQTGKLLCFREAEPKI